jgi:hypothetical protein
MHHVPESTRDLARRIALGLVEEELNAILAESTALARATREPVEDTPLARVAHRTGVSPEVLERVADAADEGQEEEAPGPESVIAYPAAVPPPYAAYPVASEEPEENDGLEPHGVAQREAMDRTVAAARQVFGGDPEETTSGA